MSSTHTHRNLAALAAACLLLSLVSRAAAEPRPQEYDVRVRYQIDAYRNARVRQFTKEMIPNLEALGLDVEPGPEDEAENLEVNRLNGTIAAANARKLLNERHVRAILLVARGVKLPSGEDPVRVDLELASFLNPRQVRILAGREPAAPDDLDAAVDRLRQQRLLADQVRAVLQDVGFREAGGYDARWHTRLVGTVPSGKLDTLLDDLRRLPAGEKQSAPLQTTWPLRIIEVMAQVPFPVQRPVPIAPPRGEERIAPELRALLADEAAAANSVRMDVILWATPAADDRSWQRRLHSVAPDIAIEGRLGPLVSVNGPAKQALALAASPEVSTVRLPRSGEPRVLVPAGVKADARPALHAAGLDKLHGIGHRGRGLRLAIVDGDFRGWQALVGKGLPKGTTYLDVTAERNRSLFPDETPGDANVLGVGTRCALAAAVAAPEADLILLRIDPAAPFMLEELARWINGERFLPVSLDVRGQDLEFDRQAVDRRQEDLTVERQALLNENVSLAPDLAERPEVYGLDPKRDAELIARQRAYVKARGALDRDQRDYQDRFRRYVRLLADLRGLRGIHLVASPLVWNEGHPVDGTSTLSRYFDERPFGAAQWFVSAGNTRDQSWSGTFHDVDGDGVLEYAGLGTSLPEGDWSPQLNFLAWEPAGQPRTAELPANARLRVSVQWREAHDPEFFHDRDDPYRPSLANLNLVLLRQLDPTAAKQPRDDLEVVAQSVSLPQRLDNEPSSATYEQTLEFTVKEPGRYVLRVEGRVPAGIRPPGAPSLPVLERHGEIHPRIFIQTLDGAGRAVFSDYAPAVGSLGMPGDARAVLTVGASGLDNRRESSSAGGTPHDLELLRKPDVLAYDVFRGTGGDDSSGTGTATGFAVGLAASVQTAGAAGRGFLERLQVLPGGVLRVPAILQTDRSVGRRCTYQAAGQAASRERR
jgi:hypothetical protein